MRQYMKKNIEIVVIAVAVVIAMLFQYIRISTLDIAFLLEVTNEQVLTYVLAIVIVPVLVLFFVFLPLLCVVEVSLRFDLPKINIQVNEVIYNIRPVQYSVHLRPHLTTVLRC